ncbi:hypothetical protein [Marinoscillum sp.]|uniref:hypothetical protein n=1 Tax=Marinoscillum sp. TaxID=2024838 RepID=UPI003BAABE13
MKVQQLENIPSGIVVMLTDNLTGSAYELTDGMTIPVSSHTTDQDKRFTLTFAYKDVLAAQLPSRLKLAGENGELKVLYPIDGLHAVTIYTLDGKVIYQSQENFQENQAIIYPRIRAHQTYILKVADESLKFVMN